MMRDAILLELAEVLRCRRKDLGLTQEELAEKIGKNRAYIARIERGETDMRFSCFMRIIHTLGLELKLTPRRVTESKRTVEVIVGHAGKNLSAFIEGASVITVGNDMKEIEDNMREAIELYLEDNPNPCEVLSGEFELRFRMKMPD